MCPVIVSIIAILAATQQSAACAPSCGSANISNTPLNNTIDRMMASDVEEAQWRGICHSFCIKSKFNVS